MKSKNTNRISVWIWIEQCTSKTEAEAVLDLPNPCLPFPPWIGVWSAKPAVLFLHELVCRRATHLTDSDCLYYHLKSIHLVKQNLHQFLLWFGQSLHTVCCSWQMFKQLHSSCIFWSVPKNTDRRSHYFPDLWHRKDEHPDFCTKVCHLRNVMWVYPASDKTQVEHLVHPWLNSNTKFTNKTNQA